MASVVETAPLVLNVGVVLTAAATMGFMARKIGLPSVIGYLITGLLVSPFTLKDKYASSVAGKISLMINCKLL